MPVLALLLALTVTVIVIALMLRFRPSWLPMDQPNERSLHNHPVPRAGGLGILTGLIVGAILADVLDTIWLAPMLALTLISWMDDHHSLPVPVRLLAQTGAAALFLYLGGGGTEPLAIGLMLFALIWMTNLFNFMDGSDGLAGGMALLGFGFYALGAVLGGDMAFALLNAALAAATLGFLAFNFPPARVFMGDTGSVPLGFLAAAFGLIGMWKGLWPWWFPVLVFSPFIIDATVTLMRRILRGERFWKAHKTHYYQRLVQMGWGHRRTALAEYALMLSAGGSALAALSLGDTVGVPVTLAFWAGGYILLASRIDREWQSHIRQGKVREQ